MEQPDDELKSIRGERVLEIVVGSHLYVKLGRWEVLVDLARVSLSKRIVFSRS